MDSYFPLYFTSMDCIKDFWACLFYPSPNALLLVFTIPDHLLALPCWIGGRDSSVGKSSTSQSGDMGLNPSWAWLGSHNVWMRGEEIASCKINYIVSVGLTDWYIIIYKQKKRKKKERRSLAVVCSEERHCQDNEVSSW